MKRAAGLLMPIVLSACTNGASVSTPTFGTPVATTVPSSTAVSTSSQPTTGPSMTESSAAPSASVVASICEDTQTQGSGNHSIGTVSGQIKSGRIVMAIEAGGQASGTFAVAYIDSSGLHEIPGVADWTTAHPVWETSTTIVFDSERAGDRHLFRAPVSGGSVSQITNDFRVGQEKAAILGDGRIVHDTYSCAAPTDLGLHITSSDGSTTTGLTAPRTTGDPGFDSQAAIAPDGHTIVFVRNVDDNTGALFSIDANGGTATRLMPDSDHVEYPRWSPDGKTILFSQDVPAGASDLWTIPAAGGSPTRVTQSDPGTIRHQGDWSPDGTQIVFAYYDFNQRWDYNELQLANADGSNESVLWKGDTSTTETPHWGP